MCSIELVSLARCVDLARELHKDVPALSYRRETARNCYNEAVACNLLAMTQIFGSAFVPLCQKMGLVVSEVIIMTRKI